MTNPPGDFIWYELMSPDPGESKAFYDSVVGWDIEPEASNEMDYRMIRRSDGGNAGGVLRLSADMAAHGARPTWLAYLHVASVDETVRSIEAVGGTTLMPGFDVPGIGRIAMVADPQGAPFYIMTPIPPGGDPDAGSDVFSPTALQRCGWNELSTSDEAAARGFYGGQFGWATDQFMAMGEMGDYRFIDHHGTRLGAMFNTPDGIVRWRFYFRVPSIAAAKDSVESGKGEVLMGPHQVPTGDWIIIGKDPHGAEFALVGGE